MKGLFQSRDGTSIYYEVTGSGRPLIFCYGLLCRRDHWRRQIPFFESRYQIVMFDYRGHQRSALPRNDQNMTLEWCANDIQDLMDFLHLKEAACLGHSVGVPVLSHLAIKEPQRIKANVFVCGSVNNPFEQMLFTRRLDSVFEMVARLNELSPAAGDLFWRKFTGKHPLAELVAGQLGFNLEAAKEEDVRNYMQGVRETAPQVFFQLMKDYRRLDRRPLLQESQIPTLVIAGDEDCITPFRVQAEMAELLPRGVLEKIDQGSHNAHMDFPDLVNSLIDEFLMKSGYTP